LVYMALPYTGQTCYGPRYWVPCLPWLAIAFVRGAECYGKLSPRLVRFVVIALAGVSAIIALSASAFPAPLIWDKPPFDPLRLLLQA
jgi:hypothetical protein